MLNVALLSLTVWLTYAYLVFKGGFVSDDFQGILEYDGQICEQKKNKCSVLNFFLHRNLCDKCRSTWYGLLSKWLKFHLCGGLYPSSRLNRDKAQIPIGKLPHRYHALQIILFNIGLVSIYFFLRRHFGEPLAFYSCLLYAVHPICAQTIAWCSAIGYTLCLMWSSLLLNLSDFLCLQHHGILIWIGGSLLIAFLTSAAVNALFAAIILPFILVYFGYWWLAIVSTFATLLFGLDVIRGTISYRTESFEDQAMGDSTHFKLRKFIFAVKTFWYYLKLMVFPKRLGLYHKWGYHYSSESEKENSEFWIGLLVCLGLFWVFLQGGPTGFAVFWMVSFIGVFLNWVTIQQVVTERYVFIPTLGICILATMVLPANLYWIVLGVALMRTWSHLPTYDDELKFYQSNVWNFEDSEVAYGNLGVTQMRVGMGGSAIDSWAMAIRINPEYDVPLYNMYSHFKANANLQVQNGRFNEAIDLLRMASTYLERAIKSRICHFKKLWNKELEEVKGYIADPFMLVINERKRCATLITNLQKKLAKEKNQEKCRGFEGSINDHIVKVTKLDEIINHDIKCLEEQITKTKDERLVRRLAYVKERLNEPDKSRRSKRRFSEKVISDADSTNCTGEPIRVQSI